MSVTASELPNGLRVVTDRMVQVETVSLGAWVEAGTRDETPEVNGISHLLEHMAFKGTERRNALQIAEEMENVGGQINAYTAREHTAYYAKVLKDDSALAVDIVADILQHSVMDKTELAREQEVIVQEISQSYDTPDDVVFDYFQETAFPDQALGRPVLGTAELVRSMTPDTLLGYMANHYAPARMVFAAAGNIEHARVVDLAESAFNALPTETNGAREAARYVGGDLHKTRDLEQAHVLLGMEGVSFNDSDFHAASVFATLLGGGMSSRLFQEVREKRGLAYAIYAYMQCYSDGGLFAVYAGTNRNDVDTLVPLVQDEIEKLTRDIPEDEIARSRIQIKAGILMSLESTSSRCEQLARQTMIFGHPLPLEETVAKIEAVDEAALIRVAERLRSGTPTLTTLGPA
ncbi:MAG: insulinase family protein [Rhodospirillales bacterium]|nr:insulinase family protein [Alphaproteobacteria bacterium]MBL6947681.1 insulinase family protein [Rhodospirillales bacterium]